MSSNDEKVELCTKKSLTRTLISSTVGGWGYGALAAVLSHPLDTIKTRKQVLPRGVGLSGLSTTALKSLYRGLLPAASASILFRAVPFTLFESVTAWLKAPNPQGNAGFDWTKHTTLASAIGGAAGGLGRAMLEFPFETLKVKAQVDIKPTNWRDIVRGFGVTAARNMAVIACFWSFMDLSKDLREQIAPVAEYRRLNAFIAGGGCSVAAWAVIFPFDVVKSNAQASISSETGKTSIGNIIKQGIQQDGSIVRFLYRGFGAGLCHARCFACVKKSKGRAHCSVLRLFLSAGLARSVVANGLAYIVYVDIKKLFEESW